MRGNPSHFGGQKVASITKRQRKAGAVSRDAGVRVRGYPTRCKSFRTRLEAENLRHAHRSRGARPHTRPRPRTDTGSERHTAAKMRQERRRPVAASLRCPREQSGDLRTGDAGSQAAKRVADSAAGAGPHARPAWLGLPLESRGYSTVMLARSMTIRFLAMSSAMNFLNSSGPL